MDNKVSESYRTFLQSFTQIITVLILIIVYFQWFGVALLPLMVGFWLAAMFYTATGTSPKSPTVSNISPRSQTSRCHSTFPCLRPLRRNINRPNDCARLRQTIRI